MKHVRFVNKSAVVFDGHVYRHEALAGHEGTFVEIKNPTGDTITAGKLLGATICQAQRVDHTPLTPVYHPAVFRLRTHYHCRYAVQPGYDLGEHPHLAGALLSAFTDNSTRQELDLPYTGLRYYRIEEIDPGSNKAVASMTAQEWVSAAYRGDCDEDLLRQQCGELAPLCDEPRTGETPPERQKTERRSPLRRLLTSISRMLSTRAA